MDKAFALEIVDWISSVDPDPLIRHSAAQLRIRAGARVLTRAENRWAASISEHVPLAGYPLAVWLAGNYWRLCWEPSRQDQPSLDWRMAHELAAAGHGFLWPSIRVESDGESVRLSLVGGDKQAREMIHYLERHPESVPLVDFSEAVLAFLDKVNERLLQFGLNDSPLMELIQALQEEQRDPELTRWRIIEASLGSDPDEGDEDTTQAYVRRAERLGLETVREIASGLGAAQAPTLEELETHVRTSGLGLDIGGIPELRFGIEESTLVPWRRGILLAQTLRRRLGLNGSAVSNAILEDALGLPRESASDGPASTAPISLAIVESEGRGRVHLRKRHPLARRFEAARLLGSLCWRRAEESWFSVTEAGTANQKLQRAFAAEFLCPFEMVQERLSEDPSEEQRLKIVDDYGVSEQTVLHQWQNHLGDEMTGPAAQA